MEAFLYITTAKELWNELTQRFGNSNGPQIYHIKREINSLIQGNMTTMVYFNKLKSLWDELICLKPFPTCSCCASKELAEMDDNDNKLIKFLMGLNSHMME